MIKVFPDKERAHSIFKMALSRETFVIDLRKVNAPATLIAETYYEVLKELCVAIALKEGYKSVGENAHKDVIDFVKKYGLTDYELSVVQDLRLRRNKSSYEGKPIENFYLDSALPALLTIIEKLKDIFTRIP
jgi:hypothetical protein